MVLQHYCYHGNPLFHTTTTIDNSNTIKIRGARSNFIFCLVLTQTCLIRTMQSMLEHQHNMFTEIINITKEIIEQQIVIKERTESLQTLNKSLQVKSLQLQQVLATSQAQLQAEISIPIELINQLAGAVRQLKDEQQERFGQLLLSLGEAHEQFENTYWKKTFRKTERMK